MRQVAYSLYLLPPRPGSGRRAQPYVSSWKMNEGEAAAIGAVGVVPGSTEMRQIPETEEEHRRALATYQSAGRDSAQPPRKA